MRALLTTNDLVRLSFFAAALRAEGIAFEVFDGAASAVDGSIGAVPRRLMVEEAAFARAERLLAELEAAGPGHGDAV